MCAACTTATWCRACAPHPIPERSPARCGFFPPSSRQNNGSAALSSRPRRSPFPTLPRSSSPARGFSSSAPLRRTAALLPPANPSHRSLLQIFSRLKF